jgi:hypothetical protein
VDLRARRIAVVYDGWMDIDVFYVYPGEDVLTLAKAVVESKLFGGSIGPSTQVEVSSGEDGPIDYFYEGTVKGLIGKKAVERAGLKRFLGDVELYED